MKLATTLVASLSLYGCTQNQDSSVSAEKENGQKLELHMKSSLPVFGILYSDKLWNVSYQTEIKPTDLAKLPNSIKYRLVTDAGEILDEGKIDRIQVQVGQLFIVDVAKVKELVKAQNKLRMVLFTVEGNTEAVHYHINIGELVTKYPLLVKEI
jgi:hypothetical protein